MAGKLKSECELPPDIRRENRRKIDDAVAAVKRNYERLSVAVGERLEKEGYEAVRDDLAWLKDMDTLIHVVDMYSADRHHFEKYHAADEDAWGRGEFYLGTSCVACDYSRSQQRAIDENSSLTKGNQ